MTAYDRWVAAGRPLTPAQPIRELVAQLKAAYPAGADQFNWYANEAHYQADPPQDHTPYSVDGWPNAAPHWYVSATDIMVNAVGGVPAAQAIFDHLLASGKDGSAPWLKYLIWQGNNYDIRNGWNAATADNHYDHIHVSTRTDYLSTGLGGWTVTGDDMPLTDADVAKIWTMAGMLFNRGTDAQQKPLVTPRDGLNRMHSTILNSWAEAKAANAGVVALT